jgi:YggT family protein
MIGLLLMILGFALNAFRLALLVRIVADIVKSLNPGWRPKGPVLVILELVFTVTDPLLNFIRRFIRPSRMGAVGVDFTPGIALLVVFFAQFLLNQVSAGF